MKSLQWGLCLLILILVSLSLQDQGRDSRAIFAAGYIFFVAMFIRSIMRERKDTDGR